MALTGVPLKTALTVLISQRLHDDDSWKDQFAMIMAEFVPHIEVLAMYLAELHDPAYCPAVPIPDPYGQERDKFCSLMQVGKMSEASEAIPSSRELQLKTASGRHDAEIRTHVKDIGLTLPQFRGIEALAFAGLTLDKLLGQDRVDASGNMCYSVMYTLLSHRQASESGFDTAIDRITAGLSQVMAG